MGDHTDGEDRIEHRSTDPQTYVQVMLAKVQRRKDNLTNGVGTFGDSYPKKIWN